MSQKWIPPLILVIIALVAFFFYNKYAVAPAVDFKKISLLDMRGQALKFESFKGKKAIVCFSASWCGACLNELMEINEIKDEQLKDIEVIVISDEPMEKIHLFREQTQYPFTFLKMVQSFNKIGINSIPVSYLFNSKQEVKKETVGYVNWADPSTYEHMKSLLE